MMDGLLTITMWCFIHDLEKAFGKIFEVVVKREESKVENFRVSSFASYKSNAIQTSTLFRSSSTKEIGNLDEL